MEWILQILFLPLITNIIKSQLVSMHISHQEIKEQWRQQVQKIRHPTAYCQACLTQKQQKDDPLITCGICESSVHKSHYAYEVVNKTPNRNHLTHNLDDWRCQRCRYLIDRKFAVQVKCEFCPFPRGIMKKVIFESQSPSRKEIWVHPECATWCYPLIWMKTKQRCMFLKETPQTPTGKFWVRVEDEPNKKCLLCADNYGYKIKCTFYSCQKFYHITCAKKIGVIRDLESMRFQPNKDEDSPAYCPIYCEEHLEAYVLDFSNRVKIYSEKKEHEKVAHFTKLHNCYKIQLKNLTTSAKRAKQEEEIRNQFGKQLMIGGFEESSMSLSVSEPRSNQMNSSDSESHSSTFLTFLEQAYDIKDLDRLLIKKKERSHEEGGTNKVRESKHEKKTTKREKKSKLQSQESISEEMNKIIEEEEKGQSMEIEDEIYERLNSIKIGEVPVVEGAGNVNFGLTQGCGKVEVGNVQAMVDEDENRKQIDQRLGSIDVIASPSPNSQLGIESLEANQAAERMVEQSGQEIVSQRGNEFLGINIQQAPQKPNFEGEISEQLMDPSPKPVIPCQSYQQGPGIDINDQSKPKFVQNNFQAYEPMEIDQPDDMLNQYQNTIEIANFQPEKPEKRMDHRELGCQNITDSAYRSKLLHEFSKNPIKLQNQQQKKSKTSPENQESSSPADPSDESYNPINE